MERQSEFAPHTWLHPVARPQECLWLPRGQRPRSASACKGQIRNKGWGVGAQMDGDHWCNQAGPVGHALPYTLALAPL